MLKKLRSRLTAIRDEAKAIVDAADTDNAGEMSAEQQTQFDALMTERETVEASISRREQLAALDGSAGRIAPPVAPATAVEVTNITGVQPVAPDPMSGFASMAEFGIVVAAACRKGAAVIDDRLAAMGGVPQVLGDAPTNFHRETGSSDGYMVPPAMRQEIWELVFSDEGILTKVSPEPTESNSVTINRDESTPWGSTGIQARWASEGSQFTPSRLETEASLVQLHKLYAFVTATEELREDAPRLQNRLTKGAARAIRFKSDEAIVGGDGVGKPLGWINGGSLVSVAKESGQSADTVVAENVLNMFSRLLEMDNSDAFWLMNRSVMTQLGIMVLGERAIWTPPNEGLKQAPGGTLLGLPIQLSQHAETLGDANDIQLISPSGYYATTKTSGVKFASSIHLYFDFDIEAFRWTFRLGGQPFAKSVVTMNKGPTQSHFITLDART